MILQFPPTQTTVEFCDFPQGFSAFPPRETHPEPGLGTGGCSSAPSRLGWGTRSRPPGTRSRLHLHILSGSWTGACRGHRSSCHTPGNVQGVCTDPGFKRNLLLAPELTALGVTDFIPHKTSAGSDSANPSQPFLPMHSNHQLPA